MRSRERAARFFIPALPRSGGSEPLHRLLADSPPAGLLFFRKDAADASGLAQRIDELRRRATRPILATIDEEGGFVTQIAPDRRPAPSARVLGRAGDEQDAERAGQETGHHLAALGIDVDFAPVFDVDAEPANPVIGPRSFSHDPHVVERLALAFARGLHAGGVLACAKHFPGHGSTGLDSHLALPVDASPRSVLDAIHLPPFRTAIAARLPIVMVSHVSFPALDATGSPATLSREIVTDLLRGELGYDGVVVTDAMEMRAVSGHLPSGEAAVRTLEAGCDLVLYGTYDPAVEAAIDAVAEAIESGRLVERALAASETRIERLFGAAAHARHHSAGAGSFVGDADRLALFRRALRPLAPAVFTASETPPIAAPGVVIEPEWPYGATLAALVEHAAGVPVRALTWDQAAESDLTDAAWRVFAHARRTAPTPSERLAMEQAIPGRSLLVAFGQDAFLAEFPALQRLSACDPGEAMRRAVAEAVAAWLGRGSGAGGRKPGALASR